MFGKFFSKILTLILVLPLGLTFIGHSPQLLAFGIAKPKPKIENERSEEVVERPFSVPKNYTHSSEIVTHWEGPESPIDFIEPDFEITSNFIEEPPVVLVEPMENLWSDKAPVENRERPDYRLKVGDTMLIAIYGQDKTVRTVAVHPNGTISYLYAESIPALGKTISQVRQELEEKLKNYLRYVTLSITPIKFNAEFYTVMGDLKEPGKQPFAGRPTILTALCKAQGFNMVEYREQMWDLCDLDKSFLAREGEYIPVDFAKLVKEGDLSQNAFLQPGDFIYVPGRMIKQVYVLGEVLSQRSVDYMDQMTLIEAIADAGDVTQRASSRVVVLRGSLTSPIRFLIDYSRIVKGYYPDFELLPGDIIYVPPRKLYLLREIFRAAVAAFVLTAGYECGLEWFIRSHPAAEAVLGGQTLLP